MYWSLTYYNLSCTYILWGLKCFIYLLISFDEEIENYKQLTIDLMSSKDNLQKVTMTTESKLKASARVDKLLSKIQNAITEASKIRDTWIGISDEVMFIINRPYGH